MKKILLLMKDKTYSKILYRSLVEYFADSYEIEICSDEILVYQDDLLYLTDQALKSNNNSLRFSDSHASEGIYKYQKFDQIVKKIEEKINNKDFFGKSKLIGLINYSFSNHFNDHRAIAKKCSEDGPTLLISINPFIRYGREDDEIGLEDLILSIKLKNNVNLNELTNKGPDFHYINSCIDPFEVLNLSVDEWNILFNLLRQSSYKYVLYEFSFSFHPTILNILKNTNQIIFFNLKEFTPDNFNETANYLTKKDYLTDNYISTQLSISNGNINNLTEMEVEKIFEFIKRG